MQTRWIKIAIAAVVASVAVGGLVITASEVGVIYYHTPSEFLPHASEFVGSIVRINGKVVTGSIAHEKIEASDFHELRFVLGDSLNNTIRVVYDGVEIPDAFREGADVVVEGEFDGTDLITARKLLVKCPSKYEAEVTVPREL